MAESRFPTGLIVAGVIVAGVIVAGPAIKGFAGALKSLTGAMSNLFGAVNAEDAARARKEIDKAQQDLRAIRALVAEAKAANHDPNVAAILDQTDAKAADAQGHLAQAKEELSVSLWDRVKAVAKITAAASVIGLLAGLWVKYLRHKGPPNPPGGTPVYINVGRAATQDEVYAPLDRSVSAAVLSPDPAPEPFDASRVEQALDAATNAVLYGLDGREAWVAGPTTVLAVPLAVPRVVATPDPAERARQLQASPSFLEKLEEWRLAVREGILQGLAHPVNLPAPVPVVPVPIFAQASRAWHTPAGQGVSSRLLLRSRR